MRCHPTIARMNNTLDSISGDESYGNKTYRFMRAQGLPTLPEPYRVIGESPERKFTWLGSRNANVALGSPFSGDGDIS